MDYKPYQVILYVFSPTLFAFALVQVFGWDWDTALLLFQAVFIGILMGIKIFLNDFQYMMEELLQQTPSIPVKVNGVSQGEIYPMTTDIVTLDLEKQFLHKMNKLWFHGADIDLTENYWLTERNWKAMGGSSDKQWRDFMNSLERRGMLKRENPNAKNKNSKRRIVARKMKEYW